MTKAKVTGSSSSTKKLRPALTPEARENQLIALAVDLVEQRLLDGTASSQETTHFLKLGSTKAVLEKKILEQQAELMAAKRDQIRSEEQRGELFKEAIAAMKRYSGHINDGGDEDDDQDIY